MNEEYHALLDSMSVAQGGIIETNWNHLREASTDELRSELHNHLIKIPGYMVPLEDNLGEVTQFLLVPSQIACIHVPPPPMNQTIFVTMKDGKPAKNQYGALWVVGRFFLFDEKGTDRLASFAMEGISVEGYR